MLSTHPGPAVFAAAAADWYIERSNVTTYPTLMERLRARRIERGLTQEVVGIGIGVSRASVANAEAGRQTVPGDVLLAWVRFLGGALILNGSD